VDAHLLHQEAVTLRPATLSVSALETIREGVARLAGRPEYRDRALGRVESLDVAAPHDVYSLGLDALVAGKGLEAAEPVARRVLIMRAADTVATAELDDREGGELSATEGPFAEATASAIARVESWPTVVEGNYELRLLRLPALYFMALWLKDESGNDHVIVPLDPAPAGLDARRGYAEDELLGELRERARSRLGGADDEAN
jgi:hypothetical protein